jgi:hypothetical protein
MESCEEFGRRLYAEAWQRGWARRGQVWARVRAGRKPKAGGWFFVRLFLSGEGELSANFLASRIEL